MANYCHSTLAWLRDRVRGRHHRAYSLAWLRITGSSICNKANFGSPLTDADITALSTSTAPDQHFVFVWSVVFLQAASEPLVIVVNTIHIRRFLFTPYLVAKHRLLFTNNYTQHTNHWSNIVRSDSFQWCSTSVVSVVTV